MSKHKMLISVLAITLELFVTASAFGAKPSNINAPAKKQIFLPHAIKIPSTQPTNTGMPCKEVRRWTKVTTFSDCDTPINKQANKSAQPSTTDAKTFLKSHARAFQLPQDLVDLKLKKVKSGLSQTVTRFQQTFRDLPVLNAFVSIHQQPSSGRVSTVHTSYITDPIMVGAATPVITQDTAEVIALEGIRQLSGVATPKLLEKATAELSWFPVDEQSITLVWVVKTRTHKPQGDFYTLVDANTGNRLLQKNQIAFATGSGRAYLPNPIQTSGILDLIDNNDATNIDLNQQRLAVGLYGLAEGTDLLKGTFVDVASYNTPTCPRPGGLCPDAKNINRAYVYTRNQPQFEQVVAYRAIDSVQRYLRDILGFKDALGRATIRNFPTLTNTHWDAEDVSFYSPFADNGKGALHFGDGGVDDAEDTDIIVHEFGHAIQHNQNDMCFPGGDYYPQWNEAPAMGEGFSDYLAASFYAESGNPAHQSLHAACVGEWDSTAYRSDMPSCLRRVDGHKFYPDDLVGEEHVDGEIWSAALWDIRAKLHGPVTDQLVLEHHFNLDCSDGVTMPQAALEIIDADKMLYAGAHEDILRAKFCDRGILVDNECTSSGAKPIMLGVKKDSTLVMGAPNRNEGASPGLSLMSLSISGNNAMRTVLNFDLSKINRSNVKAVRLVMTVQNNLGGWGLKGQHVTVQPLKFANFPEGNGRWLGVPTTRKTLGTGQGVTWSCSADNNISNIASDCNGLWNGGIALPRTTAPSVHTNDLQTGDKVIWNVSNDFKNGATTWLVKKGNEIASGQITYFSKEGNSALAPRLEIILK